MALEISRFDDLYEMQTQVNPLLALWTLATEWLIWKDEVLFGEFFRINTSQVKSGMKKFATTTKQLAEDLEHQPRPRQVLFTLSLELSEIKVLVPVIKALRNPALRDRHWTMIGDIMDQKVLISKDVSLHQLVEKYPFVMHMAKIDEVSHVASQERIIEEDLDRIQLEWTRMLLVLCKYNAHLADVPKPEQATRTAEGGRRGGAALLHTGGDLDPTDEFFAIDF